MVGTLACSQTRTRAALQGQGAGDPRAEAGGRGQTAELPAAEERPQEFALRVSNLLGTGEPSITFHFPLFRMGVSILCPSHHRLLEAGGLLVSQIHRQTEFCPMMDHIQSLAHTRFRHSGQDLGLLSC